METLGFYQSVRKISLLTMQPSRMRTKLSRDVRHEKRLSGENALFRESHQARTTTIQQPPACGYFCCLSKLDVYISQISKTIRLCYNFTNFDIRRDKI